MDLFMAVHGWGGGGGQKGLPLPKICDTFPVIMKVGTVIPYLRRYKKYLNRVTHRLSFADTSLFSPEITKFCYQDIQI